MWDPFGAAHRALPSLGHRLLTRFRFAHPHAFPVLCLLLLQQQITSCLSKFHQPKMHPQHYSVHENYVQHAVAGSRFMY